MIRQIGLELARRGLGRSKPWRRFYKLIMDDLWCVLFDADRFLLANDPEVARREAARQRTIDADAARAMVDLNNLVATLEREAAERRAAAVVSAPDNFSGAGKALGEDILRRALGFHGQGVN